MRNNSSSGSKRSRQQDPAHDFIESCEGSVTMYPSPHWPQSSRHCRGIIHHQNIVRTHASDSEDHNQMYPTGRAKL